MSTRPARVGRASLRRRTQPTMSLSEGAMAAEILLGTQGWSYPDWVGTFYPPGAKAGDFLRLYSQAFRTVEMDSTFYAAPRASMVDGWLRNTPAELEFSAKLPQLTTHENILA